MNEQLIAEEKIRRPKRSKRLAKSKKTKVRNKIIACVAVVLIGGFTINDFNKTHIYNNIIPQNVFIEDVNVSGMTKEEAISAVSSKYTPQDIKLSYENETYIISPQDIDLKYNVKEVVDNAYGYTKTESYINNVKRFFDLKKNKQEFEVKSSYDEAKLSKTIEDISNIVNVKMVDAKVSISNGGQISVSPARSGKDLDIAANKEAIYEMIKNKKYENINLKVNTKEPNVSTQAASSVDTLLAEFSTKFSMSHPGRAHNIITSANKSSDVLLMPGEEFSYNNLTGMRTVSNGYKDAPVIVNGKLEDGLGGGVCQTSSTLYNSVLYSGLQLTSIRNHSIASDYVPMGQDAMVNDGGTDFRFINPYKHPVYIKNVVSNGVLTSRVYGNSEDKKNISIKVDKFKENGLDATKTYREYKDASGKTIRTEYVAKSVYKKLKK